MSTKRVILASGSRLLREMLHCVLDKADHLEVVQEIPNHEELPSAIKRFNPEWVIVPLPMSNPARSWIDSCLAEYPSVRFIFLSPDRNGIELKPQTSSGDYFLDLTLKDFIQILEKDLQHT